MIGRPQPSEAASYYFTYIDQVEGENPLQEIEHQLEKVSPWLSRISEEKSVERYAPQKWSIRQVLNHVTDTERAFAFRALWFARGFGAALPKQLLTIDGRPILERSVALFVEHPAVDEIIVALPPELADDPPAYLVANRKPIRVVRGGMRRQDSVANAFAAVDSRCEIVVVHDAARPFATPDLISRTIAAVVSGCRNASRATVSPCHLVGVTNPI